MKRERERERLVVATSVIYRNRNSNSKFKQGHYEFFPVWLYVDQRPSKKRIAKKTEMTETMSSFALIHEAKVYKQLFKMIHSNLLSS